MGVQLVEGSDLTCEGGKVWLRSTSGLSRVDVIYRRIDDDFLDPQCFRPDSMLGVPGLMECYAAGQVAIANAPGTGVADDKLIYTYIPEIIRYYLGEDTIIPNVETYRCSDSSDRAFVLDNLEQLVVKAVSEAGGYGMLIGPASNAEERAQFREQILGNPRNFIAQPTLQLSTVPALSEGELYPCHVDLPGAACLDLHDCLHILLNRGYSTADEAFVVGFSMGNDRRCRRWHQRLLALVSHHFYPPVYRHSRRDLWQFWRGVWLGQRTLPLMQFTPQDFLRLGERLGEIRQALGLRDCCQLQA